MVHETENLALATEAKYVPAAIQVGLLFQEERKRQHLTIQDISKETHIRQLYIHCIESGELDELPGYVYIIGFIKSYAHFLGLDHEEILRQLALPDKTTEKYATFNYGVPTHYQQYPSLKVLFASLTLLFVLGLSTYIYQSALPDYNGDIQIHGQETTSVELPLIDATISQTNGVADPIKLPEAPATLSSVQTTGKIEEPLLLAPQPSQETRIKILEEPKVLGKSEATAIVDKIIVVATEDSWVQIMDDKGSNVFVRLMHAGEEYPVPQEGHYTLNTGNGGGLKFKINGEETNPIGEKGKVIRGIKLTADHLGTRAN